MDQFTTDIPLPTDNCIRKQDGNLMWFLSGENVTITQPQLYALASIAVVCNEKHEISQGKRVKERKSEININLHTKL